MRNLEQTPTAVEPRGVHSASASTKPRDASARNRWSLVAVAGVSIFMAQLDTTIVHVALPAIETELAVATAATQWVVLAFLVPLIGLSLLAGRWIDTIGHRHALSIALIGFAAASIAAGASSTASALIAARAVQGVFAALLLSLAPVLAVQAVSPQARGRALGVVGTLAPLGAMTGPIVGGQLVETLGWPWIFYTNVPIALLVLIVGRNRLPRGPRIRLPEAGWLVEAAVLGTAAVTLLLAATFAVSDGWEWATIALAAPLLVRVWLRMRTSRPIRVLLRTPGMSAVHLTFVSSYTVLLLVQFLTPFFLTRTLGASPSVTGLTLLALPATTAALGLASGALADRIDGRRIGMIGAVVVTVSLIALLPMSAAWSPASIAWRLAVLGAGFGLFMTPVTSMAMGIAPRELHGVTAASTNLARYLGLALGPAVATAAWATASYTLDGMRLAIAIAAVVSLVTVTALAHSKRQHTARGG